MREGQGPPIFFFVFAEGVIVTMDRETKQTEERQETLSAIVCFRMKPSEVEQLAQMLEPLNISRSKLIRSTLMTGGVIYVGNDLIDAIVNCRISVANVGNLLKLIAGQLQTLEQNPLLDAGDQERIEGLLQRIDGASGELMQSRRALAGTLETLHKRLEELNRGDFQGGHS